MSILTHLLKGMRRFAEKANPNRVSFNPFGAGLTVRSRGLSGVEIAANRTHKNRSFLRGARSKYMPDGMRSVSPSPAFLKVRGLA